MRLACGWIIISDKKILLIKRSSNSSMYPWFWTLPSWKQEGNETAKEVAIREVKEEVGLDFIPSDLFHSSVLNYNDISVKTFRYLWTYSWIIKIQEEEVQWYNWYNFEEAMKLNLAFDYEDVIKKLHNEKYL